MPVMDGFEATRQIMVESPTPIVIVSATVNVREVAVSMHALRVGCADVAAQAGAAATAATSTSCTAVHVDRSARWPTCAWCGASRSRPPQADRHSRSRAARRLDHRDRGVDRRTRRDLARAVRAAGGASGADLVVQHIARGFVEGLATWLNGASPLTVKVAEHGERMRAGPRLHRAGQLVTSGLADSYVDADLSRRRRSAAFVPRRPSCSSRSRASTRAAHWQSC